MSERRMKYGFCITFFILLQFFYNPQAFTAERAYIVDLLQIHIKKQPGEGGERVALVRSDDLVEILDEKDRFVRVRTKGGVEGWLGSQYVTRTEPKDIRLQRLQEEKKRLESQLVAIWNQARDPALKKQAINAVPSQEEINRLGADLAAREKTTGALQEEVKKWRQQAQTLEEQGKAAGRLNDEVKELRGEVFRLEQSGRIRWFIAGGLVFLGGWLVGKVSHRKGAKSSLTF